MSRAGLRRANNSLESVFPRDFLPGAGLLEKTTRCLLRYKVFASESELLFPEWFQDDPLPSTSYPPTRTHINRYFVCFLQNFYASRISIVIFLCFVEFSRNIEIFHAAKNFVEPAFPPN